MNDKEYEKTVTDYTNTSAFDQYNNVATSFNKGLENSIIELAKTKNDLLMSDILDKFGNYPQVHKSINRLILGNRIVLYELEDNSYQFKKYEQQRIKLADPSLSQWLDLSAQPCLTCPIYPECDLNNPVSPASCEEFEVWLKEEIELEFGSDL